MDRSYGAWNMAHQLSNNTAISGVQNAKLRYESARCFDVDEDIEFNPAMTTDELNAAYAESSLSSRSGRSDNGSPQQSQSMPLQTNPYAHQHQQQHAHQQPQHLQQASQGQNSGRYNSRKGRNNAVPIVHPHGYGNNQGAWR